MESAPTGKPNKEILAMQAVAGGGTASPKIELATPLITKADYDKNVPLTPEQSKLAETGYSSIQPIASNMFFRLGKRSGFQLSDFESWGTEGLIEAAKKFDSSKGLQFIGFARTLIKQRMLDGLRRETLVSKDHTRFIMDRSNAINSLTQELERDPTEEEIAPKMKLTLEEYLKKIKSFPPTAGLMSLEDRENNEGRENDQDSYLDSLLQKKNTNKSEKSEADEERVKALLQEFLPKLKLTENERKILDMHFLEGLTSSEIPAKLNLSDGRIGQLKTAVVEKLKKLFEAEGYKVAPKNVHSVNNKSKKASAS